MAICVPVMFFMWIGRSLGLGLAIKRNSEALKGIIAELFAMLGLDDDDHGFRGFRIPSIAPCCGCFGPAESAVRRLIVIAARGLVVKLAPSRPNSRPKPAKPIGQGRSGAAGLPPSSSLIRGNV